jgi:membrane-anchored protein YejM (alkaline phosphatase superfamily)
MYGTTSHQNPWILSFAFINTLFIAATSLFINLDSASIWSWLFRISGLIIYFGLVSSLLVLVIKIITHFYKPLLKPLTIAIFSFVQIIVFANLQIHSLYHFHINGMVLNLLFSGALLETIAFSWLMWISIGLIVVLLVFTEWGLASLIQKRSTIKYKRKFWILFWLVLSCISFTGKLSANFFSTAGDCELFAIG